MATLSGLDFITGARGTTHFGVETITGQFAGFQITAAGTTISEVLDHNGDDITSELNISGKTLEAGELHTTGRKYISSITCTAGSGIAINN